MSIKSDRWIRQMAREMNLIDPFVEEQVRKDQISYGLSSFGYDMRVADEFKIFTNVKSAIVDPKSVDDTAFVEHKGETCIVPPNSFALARSVEKFRIPRDVLAIVLGKSTYARCFRGDTRVALVDGSAVSLEDMANQAESGEMFWGYSLGKHGRIVVTLLEHPRFIGRDALLELTLDNGRLIQCTPDHGFIRRDGRGAQAHELRPGDSLMPLYRSLARGYESVYQPLNGHLFPTHRLADEWNVRNGVYEDAPGTHRHHKDHQRRNNNPWNIERVLAGEHIRHHNKINYGEEFDPDEHSLAIREALEQPNNHKIVSIRELPGEHDVFCLTVPEAGNFALEAGVFVQNCGIVVNVTPLEPEWEGYVTLEISNTTPLPARVYANEGLCQVLFLQSDEPCETSYGDKKGKYQNQPAQIVLPRLD